MWDFGIKDIIDILIVAWGMFYLYRSSQKNGTLVLFQGILAVLLAWLLLSQVLRMKLLGSIFDSLISVGLIALVVLFQNEIRNALMRVGSRRRWTALMQMFGQGDVEEEHHQWIDALVLACRNMSAQRVGALICIERFDSLQQYADTGDEIDAKLTTRLLEQIFFKNTPLHDGAVIVKNGRIQAAACILPVSHNMRIPKELGLRHRSAIGLTEVSDAKVVIVSEETGDISVACRGKVHRRLSPNALQKMLLQKED
ncbi:MAG: diadenylate cyclase CdaA [Bacteroidales bacterium]|nr:diadenylate cyclase CdaA [Bacteroidales bacterium]